jgi:hypothetical protein
MLAYDDIHDVVVLTSAGWKGSFAVPECSIARAFHHTDTCHREGYLFRGHTSQQSVVDDAALWRRFRAESDRMPSLSKHLPQGLVFFHTVKNAIPTGVLGF